MAEACGWTFHEKRIQNWSTYSRKDKQGGTTHFMGLKDVLDAERTQKH